MVREIKSTSSESRASEGKKRFIERKLRWIIRHAYEKAPAVKERMDAVRLRPADIRQVKDLEKLPIMRKEDLIAAQSKNPPYGGYLAVPPDKVEKSFVSPGPVYVPYVFGSYYRHHVEAMRDLGLRRGDLMLNTFSYQFAASHIVDYTNKVIGVTVVPTGAGNTELQIQALRFLKVTIFSGTASFLMNVVKRAEEMGYNFRRDFALRLAIVGGEKLAASLRNALEKDYGIAVRENYSTADLGPIGFDCSAHAGIHFLDEMMLLEIVDPHTGKQLGPGEIGEVVVTPFNNVFPLIRYGTGDLSSYTDEPCVCGRTSVRLVEIVGRVGDSTKVKGIFLHGRQIREVAARFPEIARVQIVVDRPENKDRITCLIAANPRVDRAKLTEGFSSLFQDICRLKLDAIEWVDQSAITESPKIILDKRVWK
jgi:phenylacetate-CoA ligase